MSRSIHTTYKDLRGLTKTELEEMAIDSDSPLSDLADKRSIKKEDEKGTEIKEE